MYRIIECPASSLELTPTLGSISMILERKMFRRQTWLNRCLVLDAAMSWDLSGSVYPDTSETVYHFCQQELDFSDARN